jgi:hypothetical protein
MESKETQVYGYVHEEKFDKWMYIAAVCRQIIIWDLPHTQRKLARTQDLLSFLTKEEKKQFKIRPEDEEELRWRLESWLPTFTELKAHLDKGYK